jgi:hypothetical protein
MAIEELVHRVRLWQCNPLVHPLTCAADSCHDLLRPEIRRDDGGGDIVVLICPTCGFIQSWIPSVVLGGLYAKDSNC